MADIFGNNSNPFGNIPGAGGPPKQNKNQIISGLYKSILGRDPDPNALMYYISLPEINEDLVRKQMIDSEEHKNILAEYKNISNLKKEIENLKNDIQMHGKGFDDKQAEIDELNVILKHKSEEIVRLKNELAQGKKNGNGSYQSVTPVNVTIDSGLKKLFKEILRKFKLID